MDCKKENAKTTPMFDMPAATAVELKDLLEYVGGAIVSRTLAKTRGGNVTLFAMATGQGLSEHTSPFNAFVQVLDGQADLTIGGKPVSPRAGQTVLMPAGVPHALHARKPFKMLLTMVRDA